MAHNQNIPNALTLEDKLQGAYECHDWETYDALRAERANDAGRAAADLVGEHIAAILRDLPRADVTACLRAE